MSIPILEPCRKRKRMPKLYGFHTFADSGCPINPTGPFRDNIRLFLQHCAIAEEYDIDGMSIWCTLLFDEDKNFVIPLYTIEEIVKHSMSPFCDHCRCAGWNENFLSKRKYHLIIPADDSWNKSLEDEDGVLDDQTHLLHGLIHCNGFGHLICINGIEGGSKSLCGKEIMDLWDRICNNLRTRKVTVEDVSKKRTVDLRLLHGVAYGHPWFGRWGYKFCRGSFGVSENNYVKAIEVLSSIKLDTIIQDFTNYGIDSKEIKQLIRYYKDLSETHMITIRDLLRIMLTLKSHAHHNVQKKSKLAPLPSTSPSTSSSSSSSWRTASKPRNSQQSNKQFAKEKPKKCRKFANVAAHMDSRWPTRRLEHTAQVIVDALNEKKQNKLSHNGMTRQEVRDAARLHIGDTGLLDYVLKNMNNVMVGSYIVRRAVNPSTRILEYSIHELNNNGNSNGVAEKINGFLLDEPEVIEPLENISAAPGADVYKDVVYIYKTVILGYPDSGLIELANRAILDCKLFVKEWPFKDEDDHLLRFICRINLKSWRELDENESMKRKESLPVGELVSVEPYSTVGELKNAVESAMKDTYCIMDELVVTEIQGLEDVEDDEVLFGMVESGMEIWARGIGMDLGTEMKYEGGAENWVVKCECGARDDDGERMIACDICEVWQHTMCCGIEDTEVVPPLFVCCACANSLVPCSTQRFDFAEYYPPLSQSITYY